MTREQRPLILMVDDDQTVLDSLLNQLRSRFSQMFSYEVATTMEEAWEVLHDADQQGKPIRLLISDWMMPQQKGDQFLIEVHQQYPDIPQVMLSGYADEDSVERARQGGNLAAYLSKPWDPEDIFSVITELNIPGPPA